MPLYVSRRLLGYIPSTPFSLANLAEGLKTPSAARIWRPETHRPPSCCGRDPSVLSAQKFRRVLPRTRPASNGAIPANVTVLALHLWLLISKSVVAQLCLIPAIFSRMPIAGPSLAGGHRVASPSAGTIARRCRSHSSTQRAARHSHTLRTTTVSGAQRHSAGPQR
jgi:hypothetical protein